IGFRVIDEKRHEREAPIAEATIMLEGPDGAIEHTAAQGNGPVNALDSALRKALGKFFPEIHEVRLHDYKVRVLGSPEGTEAVVRVLIESGDEHERWSTVGVSHNVIEASWQALVDSMDYKLHKTRRAAGAGGGRVGAGASTPITRREPAGAPRRPRPSPRCPGARRRTRPVPTARAPGRGGCSRTPAPSWPASSGPARARSSSRAVPPRRTTS